MIALFSHNTIDIIEYGYIYSIIMFSIKKAVLLAALAATATNTYAFAPSGSSLTKPFAATSKLSGSIG